MSIDPARPRAIAARARRLSVALAALALLAGAISSAVGADATGAPPAPAAAAIAPGAPIAGPADAPPSDLGQALQAVVADARERLRAITAAAKAAEDPQRTAELAAEATAVHAQMRRRLLEVQLEHALAAGDAGLAAEIEGILARLDRPAMGAPQARPLPSSTNAAAPGAR